MRGTKSVYVYEDINHSFLSPIFKTRNEALAWERGNKSIAKTGFLMKREVTKKRFSQLFKEGEE